DSAISRAESAVVMAPNDPASYFQIGYLRYRLGDVEEAVLALERSIALSTGVINANSQYFLGLSYDELGRSSEALGQFEIIRQYNPNNRQVENIIENLRAGRRAIVDNQTSPAEEIEIELEL